MTPAIEVNPAPSRSVGRLAVWEVALLVALVFAAFVLRLWPLSKSHFWDETVYLQNAEVICCGKTNYSELDSRPPLLSLIFAVAFLLWHHVYAAGVITALLNAMGPALLYLGGRMVVGRVAALMAALLLAFVPFFVGVFPNGFVSDDTGNSLLSDSPALTLLILSFWLLLRALRKQTDLRFAGAGFVLALTVLMRFASLSSVGVLSLLVYAAARPWRAALASASGFAAGIVPYLCWSRLRFGGFLTTFRHGWVYFRGPEESPFYYLRNFAGIFSWITVAGLGLWIVRWAFQKRSAHRGRPRERAPDMNAERFQLFLWLWAAVLLVFFSALHHKEARYALPLAPPLLLLAGSGLAVLLRGRSKNMRIGGYALLAGALAYAFFPLHQRFESSLIDDEVSDEMQVANFLNLSSPPGTVLYSNFNYPVFAYYTNLPVHRLKESGPGLYEELSHLPDNGILIAYKPSPEIAEPRLEWLDSNPHFHRSREFPSMVLYEYHTVLQDHPRSE